MWKRPLRWIPLTWFGWCIVVVLAALVAIMVLAGTGRAGTLALLGIALILLFLVGAPISVRHIYDSPRDPPPR